MRTTFILLVLALCSVSARAVDLTLFIDHRMQGEALQAGTTYAMDNGAWYFKPRFVKYYLAEITVIHDGGKRTPLTDVYVLVDALGQKRYPLGSYDVTNVEALEFHIGVDKPRNHLDPTLYPSEHPLALKNPTMHWGWAAGYRFLAVEGSAGTSKDVVSADVQVHTVGDELYRKITMPVSTTPTSSGVEINLAAEYSKLFAGLDVSFGLIFHGYGEETIVMSNNVATRVFSSPTTSVTDLSQAQALTVWPTPTSGTITVRSDRDVLAHAMLVDAWGSTRILPVSQDSHNAWDLTMVASGTYTLVATTTSGSTRHVPVVLLR
jgi:hypothetical protein